MFHVRINVPNAGPLDGATALDPNSIVQPFDDGVILIAVPAASPLGLFDPSTALLGVLGAQANLILQHILVSSAGGDHAVGSVMGIVGPTEGGLIPFLPKRTLIDFGLDPSDDVESGIVSEGQCYPIPAGHQLFFDTQADGVAPGPHVIQLTFQPAPSLLQSCLPPIDTPP